MADPDLFPNLKPVKPGQVLNPNGRPVGSLNAKTIINRWLKAKEKIKHPITGKEVRLSQLDIITLAQLKEARTGNTAAFNALLDRTEGRPEQKQIHDFDEGTEIIVRVGKKKEQPPAEELPEPGA